MPDRISRRMVLAAIPAAAALAQTAPPPLTAAALAGKDQGDKLQKAIADVKDSSTRLGQISIPMDLEPAVTFHV